MDRMDERYKQLMFPDFAEKNLNAKQNELLEARVKEAYQKAHDLRKFEIELYWKRALYFWGFEAAFMLAFGKICTESPFTNYQHFLLSIISLLAFCFSCLWLLAQEGAKRWQENWEFHIDMLEESISGNLYKTVLHKNNTVHNFYSVSKINKAICFLFIILWAVLFVPPCAFTTENILKATGVDSLKGIEYILPTLIIVASYALGSWFASSHLKTNFEKQVTINAHSRKTSLDQDDSN